MRDNGRMSSTEMSPEQLVAGATQFDGGAWEALIERYGRMVACIARAHGLSEADAADVAQTVWLRLVEHISTIRDPQRIGSWLATTTRNECTRVWHQRAKLTVISNAEVMDLIVDESAPEPKVETHDRDVQLRATVATLPRRQQAILGLLMSDDAPSYVQVAAGLGIAVGSIGPMRKRGLGALRLKCVADSIDVA